MSKNPVVHFEMPYENLERVTKFYEKALGWGMHNTGKDMDNYVVAHTAETDENNMVKTTGTINGGFFRKKPDWPAQYPSVVIAVDNINEAMESVKEAGGEVLGEPMDIPTVGKYVSFMDSEGNRVSLLQPTNQ